MSDVELLFLVLALIYVWECSNWVTLGGTTFTTWLGSRWHRISPTLRNQKGGFVFTPFFPPLGGILGVNPPALLIAPQGLLAARPASGSKGESTILAWNELRKIEVEGKNLLINGKPFARAYSVTQARQTVDQVRDLLKVAPGARENALLKSMQERFRIKTALQKWKAFSLRTANLQFLANALLVYLFGSHHWPFGVRAWVGLANTAGRLVCFDVQHRVYVSQHAQAFFPGSEGRPLHSYIDQHVLARNDDSSAGRAFAAIAREFSSSGDCQGLLQGIGVQGNGTHRGSGFPFSFQANPASNVRTRAVHCSLLQRSREEDAGRVSAKARDQDRRLAASSGTHGRNLPGILPALPCAIHLYRRRVPRLRRSKVGRVPCGWRKEGRTGPVAVAQ